MRDWLESFKSIGARRIQDVYVPMADPTGQLIYETCMGFPPDVELFHAAPFETRAWVAANLREVRASVRRVTASARKGPVFVVVSNRTDGRLDAWILLPDHDKNRQHVTHAGQIGRNHSWMRRVLHHPIYVAAAKDCYRPCSGEPSKRTVMGGSFLEIITRHQVVPCGGAADGDARSNFRVPVRRVFIVFRAAERSAAALKSCFLPEGLTLQAYCHHQLVSPNQRFGLILASPAGLMFYENLSGENVLESCAKGNMPRRVRARWIVGAGVSGGAQLELAGAQLVLSDNGQLVWMHEFPVPANTPGPYTLEITNDGTLRLLDARSRPLGGSFRAPAPPLDPAAAVAQRAAQRLAHNDARARAARSVLATEAARQAYDQVATKEEQVRPPTTRPTGPTRVEYCPTAPFHIV